MSLTIWSKLEINVYWRQLCFGTVWIAWIKPSWEFRVNDINSYLFAYTAVITKNLDHIKYSAKLEAKNNLGVYDISDEKVALLDYC